MKPNTICCWLKAQSTVKSSLRTALMILIILTNLYAQEEDILFTHLTAEDGLSLNVVTQIVQDSQGFMWFGTYNGLNRYDGYNFKVFLPELSNPHSISSHSIWSIYEDSKGNIWIGTLEGLNRYDWKTEKFYRYKHNPDDPHSLSHNFIYSIFEDKSGTLWIGTLDGLNKYNYEEDNFSVIKKVSKKLNADSLNSVKSITQDSDGRLWLGTWDGLTYMQKNGTIIKQLLPGNKGSKNFTLNNISIVFCDNSDNVLIGTSGNGIERFNPKTGNLDYYRTISKNLNSISDDYINTVYQDKLNNIWIGTKNGLNQFDPKRNTFTRIRHEPLKPSSIINNDILSINGDNTGVVWFGTSGGVSRFYPTINNFKYYQVVPNRPEISLSSNRVNSVFIDGKENIWLGTMEGLDKIEKGTGRIVHFKPEPGNNNSLSNKYVMSVIEDRSGVIWIGTEGGGLNSYNPLTQKFGAYKYDINEPESISNNGVTALCEDHNGTLWAGTWWGLNRFNRERETFFRYVPDQTNPNGLLNNIIWVIYEDSKGMLWLGTDGGGVSKFNPNKNTFTNYVKDTSSVQNSISGNRVISILESADGMMWFGTTEGLNGYNRTTNRFIVYKQENGLPSNSINGIQEDGNNNLWISTDKGLSKFDRKTKTFLTFTKRNGLKEIEFSPDASAKSKNGELFFGSNSNLTFFYPDSIKGESLTAPLVFTDFKIFNQSVPISNNGNSVLKESITGSRQISIPYENDVITIEFALLDYFNVKKNSFSYKLDGFETGWNNVGNRNTATYTNLPPGEYIFRVKAFNSNGIKNTTDASLKITIVPAFYQTWLFRIVLGLGILLTAILIAQGRTKKIKRQNKILEKHVSDRTKDLDKTIGELNQEIIERKKAEEIIQTSLKEKEALLDEKEVLLKEVHHRVKNNLQVISSLLFLSSKKIKDKEAMSLFTDSQNRVRSIALVHERLYQSKDLGKIDFKEYVREFTSDLFSSYGIDESVIKLEININNILINTDIAVPCGLIINELITNSLKYAFPNFNDEKERFIKIDLYQNENNEFLLIVGDNGIGMPEGLEEKKKNSLGLQLVETLVTQLEGTLMLDSRNGTTFKIKFNSN